MAAPNLFVVVLIVSAIVMPDNSRVAAATRAEQLPTAVDGILIGPVAARADPVCTRFGFECMDDCQRFMVMEKHFLHQVSYNFWVLFVRFFVQICSELQQTGEIRRCAAETPYCVNNVCTATLDITNDRCLGGQAHDTFVCTSAGMFPDPHNCSVYYSCPAMAPAVATQFRCPDGSSYDSAAQACMRPVSTGRLQRRTFGTSAAEARLHPWCSTQMCPRNGRIGNVAYPPNPAYYVFCFGAERMVFRCPDEQNQVYDAKLVQCVFRCRSAGNFADRQDCRQFYTCTRRGSSRFTVQRNSCALGFAFRNGRCQREGTESCRPEIEV